MLSKSKNYMLFLNPFLNRLVILKSVQQNHPNAKNGIYQSLKTAAEARAKEQLFS